ncbi:MAG TPA: TIM barrel protein [Bacteroidales bacterium]|nr:TIM barrel protein [Bacteroidales bacterium]
MQIGVSTYTYTWSFGVPGSEPKVKMTPYDLIRRASEFGIDCIQIADNYPLHQLTDTELHTLMEYAHQIGITIEVGSRGLTGENLEKYLKIAEKLYSPILRMVIDQENYRPEPEDVVAIIRNALPELKARNIILALENHDRLHAKVFREIVESIASEFAGICLDCINSMGIGEGIETVIDILAPYTVNLHVKDFNVKRVYHKMGFIIEGTPAGKGLLNMEMILEKLSKNSKCRSAILELWTPPEQNIELTVAKEHRWAIESIGYMKKMILK